MLARLAAPLLVLLAAGCAKAPQPVPLSHTFDSVEALATAVLDAYARRDDARLLALAVSTDEFRDHVWPELPAARPERNLPLEYVWGDLEQKSRASLQALLAQHGGLSVNLAGVRFAGDTTRYGTYAVARKAVLDVRQQDGSTASLRLFGSVLQKDGRFKVFSYVTD